MVEAAHRSRDSRDASRDAPPGGAHRYGHKREDGSGAAARPAGLRLRGGFCRRRRGPVEHKLRPSILRADERRRVDRDVRRRLDRACPVGCRRSGQEVRPGCRARGCEG